MTVTTSGKIDPTRAFAQIAGAAALTAVALALVGYFPTVAQAGQAGAAAMGLGIGIALLGAWLGSLVPFFFLHRPLREFPLGILAGLGVRFAATLGLAVGVNALHAVPEQPLLIWVGIGQVVILAADMIGLLRVARQVAGKGP